MNLYRLDPPDDHDPLNPPAGNHAPQRPMAELLADLDEKLQAALNPTMCQHCNTPLRKDEPCWLCRWACAAGVMVPAPDRTLGRPYRWHKRDVLRVLDGVKGRAA